MQTYGDQKVTQPIPDIRSICQENYLHLNYKTGNNVVLSVGNVHQVPHGRLKLKIDRNGLCSAALPVSQKCLARRDTIDFFGHRRIGKCILNSF
jgi:hypothetical protein